MYSFQKFATLNGGKGGGVGFEQFKPKVMKCPKHFVQDCLKKCESYKSPNSKKNLKIML